MARTKTSLNRDAGPTVRASVFRIDICSSAQAIPQSTTHKVNREKGVTTHNYKHNAPSKMTSSSLACTKDDHSDLTGSTTSHWEDYIVEVDDEELVLDDSTLLNLQGTWISGAALR